MRLIHRNNGDLTLASGMVIGQVVKNDSGLWEGRYDGLPVADGDGLVPASQCRLEAAMEVWNAFMQKSPVAVAL